MSYPTDTPGLKVRAKDGRPLKPGQRVRLPDGRLGTVTGKAHKSSRPRNGNGSTGVPRGPEWTALSNKIRARDHWQCIRCHVQYEPFNAPDLWACHLLPWTLYPEQRYDESKIVSLCPRCDPDRNPAMRPSWWGKAAEPEPEKTVGLFGTPCTGWVTRPQILAAWFAQGFGVWALILLPPSLFWALAIDHLSGDTLSWWLLNSIPGWMIMTVYGIYVTRLFHRKAWPSRTARWLWVRFTVSLRWAWMRRPGGRR